MITRPGTNLVKLSYSRHGLRTVSLRHFSASKQQPAKNRIYTPVRRADDFYSYLALSTSSRKPLLTFWTASYCNTCKTVSPLLHELLESGVGEAEGAVSFCEVEYDCPDIMSSGLGMTYMITSMPTLISFDRGEAQTSTKITDPKMMADREWLKEWIRTEARRQGGGGGGEGNVGAGFFGGLFGNTR